MFELFNRGLINKKSLLILNYSKLSINENQLAIILLIMEMSNDDTKSFTPTQIAKYMSISKEDVETELSDLISNNLVIIEQRNKKSVLNLSPIFTKILIEIEEEINKNNVNENYRYIEKIINEELTSEQIEELQQFVDKGISNQKIKALLIEKQIKTYADLVKELAVAVKNKNPIKITKYNWLND